MATATFRFYEELNDFLPASRRRRDFSHRFAARSSLKEVLEGLGVPHTEVELVLVDGRSVDWNHRLEGGERVSVYPMFESLDVSPLVRLRPSPLRTPRFVLDVHLGRLARLLRMLGLDSVYSDRAADAELARVAQREGRILLTRDRGLLKRRIVERGLCVRSTDPWRQLREVVDRLDLREQVRPFGRCMACNGELHPVEKEEVLDRLLPLTRRHYHSFWRCAQCDRLYWQGSHHARMQRRIREVLMKLESPAFTEGSPIPVRHTCDGEDLSPPLRWSHLPEGTASLALVVDDPDAPDPRAPRMTWVHWLLYNLPPDVEGLAEGASGARLPRGTLEGLNDWKRTGYGGPCPPIGQHRYFHRLYALDARLEGLKTPTKAQLLAAMEGHVLAQVELMGTYRRG